MQDATGRGKSDRTEDSHEKPLQSWKEIAAYLDRDERTAQRWEKDEGLPVRRHREDRRGSVYAYPSELNAWRVAREPKSTEIQSEPPLWHWRVPAAIGILAVVLGALFIRYSPILNPPNPMVEAADGIVLREVLKVDGSGTPSPDGRLLSFVDWETGEGDVAIADLTSGQRRHLTQNASDVSEDFALRCAISSDGREIAYDWFVENEDRCELRVIGLDGSNPRTILGKETELYHEGIAWSSDGKHILTIGFSEHRKQLVRVSVADGSVAVLETLGEKWPGRIFPSPDNRYLAYSYTSKKYPPQFDVFLVSTDGSGETTVLVEHPANERALGWVPGRDDLIFLSDRSGTWDLWVLSVRNGQPIGDPARVYTNLGDVTPVGFANDGTYFYQVYSRWVNNYVANINPQTGKPLGAITQPLVGYTRSLDWSPDGRYLAYVSVESTPEGPSVFMGFLHIRDLENSSDRIVPCDLMGVVDVRWAPDGKSLLLSGFERRQVVDHRLKTGLYLFEAETAVTKCLVERPDQRITIGEWATEGEGIYFVRGDSLFRYDLKSGQEEGIFNQAQLTGRMALSPDGLSLAIGAEDPKEGSEALIMIDVSSGDSKQLVSYPKADVIRGLFDWTTDGRYLCYLKRDKEGTSLCRIDPQSGTPEKVWETEKRVYDLRFHPDGQQMVFAETQHDTTVWVMENLLPKESTSN